MGTPSSLNVHIQGLVTLADRDASIQLRRGVTDDFCGIEIQWRVKYAQNLFNDRTGQLPSGKGHKCCINFANSQGANSSFLHSCGSSQYERQKGVGKKSKQQKKKKKERKKWRKGEDGP